MPLTTVLSAKDISSAFAPLLLAEITFSDGTVLRMSTLDFRASTTGVQYLGNDYLPQILNQDMAARQALSADGIDSVPTVTLKLADADRFLWSNYELTKGFKGSSLLLRFVFFDLSTNTFSTDSKIIFRGICDPPNMDEDTMSIRAVSKMNMVRSNLPTTRIQRRDPHPFPNTLADRTSALNDPSSPFYACGYSADVVGGFGNLNPATGLAFTAGDYDGTYESYLKALGRSLGPGTAATGTVTVDPTTHWVTGITITSPGSGYTTAPFVVIAGNGGGAKAVATISGGQVTGVTITDHGQGYNTATVVFSGGLGNNDLLHDNSGRSTGTFGGVRWVPPNTFNGRSYVSGKIVTGSNAINQNLYSDFVPMIYGTGMVQPPVVSVLGDPNSTRGEAILCLGKITGIVNNQVVVNNVNITAATDITGTINFPVNDALVRFNIISQGDRHGNVNRDAIFDGNGDCYGSMATIEWVVYNQIASSSSIPDIRATVQGPAVRVYTDPNTFTEVYSDNPAWILLDLLVKSGAWTYTDIDIQSFINAAAVCGRSINYTKTDGTVGTHPLFQTSLVIRQRKSAADYIKGLRTSFRATLVDNSGNNGLLQLFVDQTLADQQPSPIAGSNYNTAIASIDHNGAAASGYVAYDFSDTNGTILRNGKKSTLKITQTPIGSTPNQLSFSFQDSENQYQQDSVTIVDAVDISRVIQEVSTSFVVEGISSFDHAQRIGAWWLSKTLRGNPRGDSGGTLRFQWDTNFKALHLQVGQIVRLSSAHDGISNALVRLTSVKPSTNFETVTLEGDYHIDDWYQDNYGQSGFVSLANPGRAPNTRLPYPWFPNEVAGLSSDPLYSTTNFTFNVAQEYTTDAAGNAIANLLIHGETPINNFSNIIQPPLVRPAFSTASTGGTVPGNRMYSLCVCATDTNGDITGPSDVVNVFVSAGTNTNTITLTDLTWFQNTAGYALYAGLSPNTMCLQATGAGTPSSISLTAFKERTAGVPDIQFSKLRAKIKNEIHGGVLGTNIGSVTSSTIVCDGQTWTTNQWAGRVVTVVGDKDDFNNLPVWNFTISSNTADTLTVSGNPLAAGIGSQDVIVIRTLADTFTANTIGDSQFVNSTEGAGLAVNAEVGNKVRIIAGTGVGQPPLTISSNTATVLTVDGTFDPIPDATSVFIVEGATWIESYDTDALNNSSSDITLRLRIDNFLDETLLVQVSTVDSNGRESLEANSVWREIYVFGSLDENSLVPVLTWQESLDSLPQDVV